MLDSQIQGMSAENIDKDTPIPYHYQLRELLRGEVDAGHWKAGERLPSERELCELFDLSRTTVREAIDALVNEGLLRREKGRGTFVAGPKIMEGLLQSPTGFTDSMLAQGYTVKTQVLRQEVILAPPRVAQELGLGLGELVTVIDRLRFVLDEPLLVVHSYVPQKMCPPLVREDLVNNSLYHILQDKYNLQIARAKRFMEAVLASEVEAKLLNIESCAPLMLIESTAYLEDGTPLEYFKTLHRGDRTRFLVESWKVVIDV